MFPDLRFVAAAALFSVMLLSGAVALVASRIPAALGQHGLREHAPPLALVEARTAPRHGDDLRRGLSIQLGPAEARAGAMPPPREEIREVVAAAVMRPAPAASLPATAEPDLRATDISAAPAPAAAPVALPALAAQETRETPRGAAAEIVADTVHPPLVLLASLSISTPRVLADFDLNATVPPPAPAPMIAASLSSAEAVAEAPEPAPAAAPVIDPESHPALAVEPAVESVAPRPVARPHKPAARPMPPRRPRVVARAPRAKPRPKPHRAAPARRPAANATQAYWQQQQQWWGSWPQQQQPQARGKRAGARSKAQ